MLLWLTIVFHLVFFNFKGYLMKKLFFVCLLLLVSCATQYPEVTDVENSAILKFSHDTDAPLGSSSTFMKADKDFRCNSGGGAMDQLQLAFVSNGNPLARSKNHNGIKVLAEDNFRVLARNVAAGGGRCDVIIDFNVEKQKTYAINFTRRAGVCAATVIEVNNDVKDVINVELLNSESC